MKPPPTQSCRFTARCVRWAAAVVLLAAPGLGWSDDVPVDAPYKNLDLPFAKRVADLVGRMTLDEKAVQLQFMAPPNGRLGIPACCWWTEGLHGLTRGGGGRGGRGATMAGPEGPAFGPGNPTIFPDGIAMAATWDTDLVKQISSAIADEARARFDPAGSRMRGIILFCPTINLARDPRWGRTSETFGEDPHLASRLAVAYVQGLQGDDPKYLKTVATPKHFVGYNQENERMRRNALISERFLREYYLAPFEAAVMEGHAQSIMAAYNAVNGVPCAGNYWLLTELLREEWNFDGAVICDSNAIMQMYQGHGFVESPEKGLALGINAGLDVVNDGSMTASMLVNAVQAGRIKAEALDRAITHNLMVRFRLGMFDPPERVPFTQTPVTTIGSAEHIALALQAARESIVLLKNDPAPKGRGLERLLPIDLRRVDSVAVVGPLAAIRQFGSYGGVAGGTSPTPLDAIRAAVGERVVVRVASGEEDAVRVAENSDVVIVVAGLNNQLERTGTDRPNLDLLMDQRSLIERVVKANPQTIVVLEGGGAVNVAWMQEHCPAILMLWYPGDQGGTALADVLFGQYNPSGRLPQTFYKANEDLPSMDEYDLTPAALAEMAVAVPATGPATSQPATAPGRGGLAGAWAGNGGRTYMYLAKPPAFAFGHGLSYTTFGYSNLRLEVAAAGTPPLQGHAPATASAGASLEPGAGNGGSPAAVMVTLDVTNTGSYAGDEVVQVYMRKPHSAVSRPLKQLVAFGRVNLEKGATKTVRLAVSARALSYWDTETRAFTLEPGTYEIVVAGSSAPGPTAAQCRGTIELK